MANPTDDQAAKEIAEKIIDLTSRPTYEVLREPIDKNLNER